jgi:transcriptional regulator with XRE-family HTH domain
MKGGNALKLLTRATERKSRETMDAHMEEKYGDSVEKLNFKGRLKYYYKKSPSLNTYEKLAEAIDVEPLTIKNYMSGRTRPTDKNIKKIEKALGIPSEYLTRVKDPTRTERLLERVTDEDRKKYFYEIYDPDLPDDEFTKIAQEMEQVEDDCLLKEIEDKFMEKELFRCYKLLDFFDAYVKIKRDAACFVYFCAALDYEGRLKLSKYLFQSMTTVREQLKNLKHIDNILPFLELQQEDDAEIERRFGEWQTKQEAEGNRDNDRKDLLFKEFNEKLTNHVLTDLHTFNILMDYITSMEKEDWDILMGYMLLGDGLLPPLQRKPIYSSQQEFLLGVAETLVWEQYDETAGCNPPEECDPLKETENKFMEMEPLQCYKLLDFFDAYIQIGKDTACFMSLYSALNSERKLKLSNRLFQSTLTVQEQLKTLKKPKYIDNIRIFLQLQKEAETEIEKRFRTWQTKRNIRRNNADDQKSRMFEEFNEKLTEHTSFDRNTFNMLMDCITSMEKADWDVLMGYTLLRGSSKMPSLQQEFLMKAAKTPVWEQQDEDDYIAGIAEKEL